MCLPGAEHYTIFTPVMSRVAYSAINGTPDNCNEFLLKQVLRQDWNFTGVAFSDNSGVAMISDDQHYASDHVHAAALALNAGLDQDMASGGPGSGGMCCGARPERRGVRSTHGPEADVW